MYLSVTENSCMANGSVETARESVLTYKDKTIYSVVKTAYVHRSFICSTFILVILYLHLLQLLFIKTREVNLMGNALIILWVDMELILSFSWNGSKELNSSWS